MEVSVLVSSTRECSGRRRLARGFSLLLSEKNWKFSIAGVQERQHWDEYQDAYESMIRGIASEHAPWYVIPADHKWFTRLVVAAVIVETLESFDVDFPVLDPARRAELATARKLLAGGKPTRRC
jgi:hypothetical protein